MDFRSYARNHFSLIGFFLHEAGLGGDLGEEESSGCWTGSCSGSAGEIGRVGVGGCMSCTCWTGRSWMGCWTGKCGRGWAWLTLTGAGEKGLEGGQASREICSLNIFNYLVTHRF